MPLDVNVLAETVVALVKDALAPVYERLAIAEAQLQIALSGDVAKDVGLLRERIAAVEVKAMQPGPAGADGKDGADGFSLDDFSAEFDGDRTLSLRFQRGDVTKQCALRLPFVKYEGTHQDGRSYQLGDAITCDGMVWFCKSATMTRPTFGSPHWQLMVKRGDVKKVVVRDGTERTV